MAVTSIVVTVNSTVQTPASIVVGIQGSPGVRGSDGAAGPTGATGAAGADGAAGVPGAAGADGSRFYYGTTAPADELGQDGDFYFNSATGDVWTHGGSAGWNYSVNLTGPQGPQGATGATGASGTNGANGADGAQGAAGAAGTQVYGGTGAPSDSIGQDGDWYIDTASGLLYQHGGSTGWNVSLSLVGAQGPQGIQGPQGTAGATGATGATGPAGAGASMDILVDGVTIKTGADRLEFPSTEFDVTEQSDGSMVVSTIKAPTEVTASSYNFALADIGTTKLFNSASAQTLTIPAESTFAAPIGSKIRCFRKGAGLPKIVAGAGVNLLLPTGIKPPRSMGALVRKASNQTGANYSAGALVAWDQESYDTDAFHDNATNNSRLTIPANLGIKKALLSSCLIITSITSNVVTNIGIYKNNAAFDGIPQNIGTGANTSIGIGVTSGHCLVSDGDYFETFFQTTDASVDITATQSFLSLEVIEIDAQGYIAYQYGVVEIEKIGTNEWVFSDQSALG